MPIELKGLNYYSKVFKMINYRLSNSTFWVVIIYPLLQWVHVIYMSWKKNLINIKTLNKSWFGLN